MIDWSSLTLVTSIVLFIVLLAEAANGWTDAPTGTSAAVASEALQPFTALWVTAVCNFIGLIAAFWVGAKVAQTIGTGIVRPDLISIPSIGVAMLTTVIWSSTAGWMGLPISKTHSLLAALAGIGFAQGGLEALLPASGNLWDSGWVSVGKGVFYAIALGSAVSWFLGKLVTQLKWDQWSDDWWKWAQRGTVCMVASGHGFNDGLKYVGIFTLVLLKAGMIPKFEVSAFTIILCAIVMGVSTLIAGWRIHKSLDKMVNGDHADTPVGTPKPKKTFRPYMGVCAELTAGFSIWQTGFLGIPMSTNHAVVSSMAGARSSNGKVHTGSVVKILWGWVITYIFCFYIAQVLTQMIL